jgi:hypothetical protein
MRPKVKPHWPTVFDQFRKSGLTKADFCRTHKISLSSISYYSKLHSQEHQLVPVVQSSSSFILLSTDIKLSAVEIIKLYGLRF